MNINNITESFRQVFISPKNSGYLFDIIISKTIKSNQHLQPIIFNHINQYRNNLIDLQKLVFDDYFLAIYKSNNVDLEDVLIELNKLAVSKFEMILLNDLNSKYKQQTTSQPQQSTTQPQPRQQLQVQPIQQLQVQAQPQPRQQLQVQAQPQPQPKQTPAQQLIKQQVPQKEPSIYSEDSDYDEYYLSYYKEFSSQNAVYTNGKYTFPFSLKNIKSARIDNMRLKCNMYNISENNNKFVLVEQKNKNVVTIPIGYYDIDALLETIEFCMNNISVNKKKDYIYKVYNNKIKNRIVFQCNVIEPEKYTRNTTFGIYFSKDYTELRNMLGFQRDEYSNNNIYLAEMQHNISIYDQIYIKVYIDNKELRKYNTSADDFYFFETFYLDMSHSYGKSASLTPNENSVFVFDDTISSKTLSIEFDTDYNSIITQPIHFKCLMSFEYQQ
jgi:hypothetical protein